MELDRFEGYRNGDMMHLRQEGLAAANEHLREFIAESTPAKGQPATYP